MKIYSLVFLSFFTLAAAAFPQEAYSGPKEKLHIYILAGQSNMSGRGKVEPQDQKLPKNLYLLNGQGKWVPASHPFIQYTNVPNGADLRVLKSEGKVGLNLGLEFSRKMLEAYPDTAVGLVVNSQGGSAVETWMLSAKKTNYLKTMERVRPIVETGVVKGVLWHQGEANAALGEKYLDSLAQVIEQFRKDLKDPKLPFVAGQLAPVSSGKDKIEAFNKALLQLPMRVPMTAVVSTQGFRGNDIHFDSDEIRKLGTLYAEAMLKLQGK